MCDMISIRRQKLFKSAAAAVAAVVTAGCFLAIPRIAEALPASLMAFLTLSPVREPITALRPEPKPHESLLWEDEKEETTPPKEESDEESIAPPPSPPENAISVMAGSYCWYEIGEIPTMDLMNRTSYSVDLESYLWRDFPIKPPEEEGPLVLIVHTHGTEAYLPDGVEYYLPEDSFRSENPAETVVAVGEVIAHALELMGIGVVHDTTMHDKDSFNDAYTHSAAAVKEYLKKYPTIRYVIDVHRDSIFDGNNVCGKTLTTADGLETAQLMLVVGTDESGASHPNWKKNLTLAAYLQERMNHLYPTLARPVNLREHGFNQWLSTGSLILEVGSCGNTLEEAKQAGAFFAYAFADLLAKQR